MSKTILWVENDEHCRARISKMFEVLGFKVIEATDAKSAMRTLEAKGKSIGLAILDVAMDDGGVFPGIKSAGGTETGLLLGGWIHDRYPKMPVIGFSLSTSAEVRDWFTQYGDGFFRKGSEDWMLLDHVKVKLGLGHIYSRGPKIFIVHGHDESPISDLKKALKSFLKKPLDVVILKDLAGEGRTIIEKFEHTAEHVDIVFVILSPDDYGYPRSSPEKVKGRARQNVVFELGYFYAKLQRTRGRVIVLSKGDVERPSDIAGIEYINITDGIASASAKIKAELSRWL